MVIQHRFDRRYGKGAFACLRSMLDDPTLRYECIAKKLGLTKQRIGQLAKDFGVDGRKREQERWSRRQPHIVKPFKEYPSDIRAVMNKLSRAGLRVTPYNSPQPSRPNLFLTLQKIVVVNGVVCAIQPRKAGTKSPYGREYARFDVNDTTKRARVALWAMRSGRLLRVYVVPLTHLRNVTSVYIPVEGRYAVGHNIKPQRDWTRYEAAWHLLTGAKTL